MHLAILSALILACSAPGPAAESLLARQILDQTGVHGGLVVHLGCGQGRLTAALRAGEGYLIHGLDPDATNVEAARRYITSLGLYGPVSVARLEGPRLPYAENCVNLLVAEGPGDVSAEELLRVLAPGGAAYVNRAGKWTTTVKPRPADIDEWTHYHYDASNNAVAHDQQVGPPRRLQWTAGPPHGRSHSYGPGIDALVSSGGRIFYIVDEGSLGSLREPARWRLAARDAFNGLNLWEKPVDQWYPHMVFFTEAPAELERKLVAVGQRVYVPLGLHAPLSVLDAASGRTLATFEDTAGTEEIVWHQGILLLVVRAVTEEKTAALRRWGQMLDTEDPALYRDETARPLSKQLKDTVAGGQASILALDAESGRRLWTRPLPGPALQAKSLSASGQRVFYRFGPEVTCLDLQTGKKQWSTQAPSLRAVAADMVLCADRSELTALSVANGHVRWTARALNSILEVFFAAGSVWLGGEIYPSQHGQPAPPHGPYRLMQFDPANGRMLREFVYDNPGHHHRCYDNKATDRYILAGRRGTEFIDLTSGEISWNSWCRGVCRYGIMPANGLLYCPPHACACYMRTKLLGFNALAPARDEGRETSEEGRGAAVIERGPAYDTLASSPSPLASTDWPAYRHDAARSGFTKMPAPAGLKCLWQADLGGKLSSPVICQGRLYVASVDAHRVQALDAGSGQVLWSYTADARVDSAPTLLSEPGRVLFGCADGCVYCLRAADGALAWRLQVARQPRLLVANEQLESAWPIPGSVLVQDGVAYCTAGRSTYMDGGIDLCRLDPASGRLLSRTAFYSPEPRTGQQPGELLEDTMPGQRNDVLSADKGHVYLRDAVFSPNGVAMTEGEPHLFALTEYLDESWQNRSSWSFGTVCGSWSQHTYPLLARQIVFTESTVYGYGPANVHWSNGFQDGPYRLFARQRDQQQNQWAVKLPIQVRAMLLADQTLFAAGSPSTHPPMPDEGSAPRLLAVSAADGRVVTEYPLDGRPILDGLAAAGGRLYITLEGGRIVCLAPGE